MLFLAAQTKTYEGRVMCFTQNTTKQRIISFLKLGRTSQWKLYPILYYVLYTFLTTKKTYDNKNIKTCFQTLIINTKMFLHLYFKRCAQCVFGAVKTCRNSALLVTNWRSMGRKLNLATRVFSTGTFVTHVWDHFTAYWKSYIYDVFLWMTHFSTKQKAGKWYVLIKCSHFINNLTLRFNK